MDSLVRERLADCTVFVVDDDAAMRDSLQALFEVRGFRVECFDSARAFRARHGRDTLGCLIVDLNMPEAGGLDLLQMLAVEGYRLPAIVMSGQFSGDYCARALAAGAVACLDKPFEPARLVETVLRAMPAGAGAPE
jgi:FixJ family two-component response regulator